jgi:ATP-dependent DNA helicase 2 subunit 2
VSGNSFKLHSLDRTACRQRKPWYDPSLSFNPAVHRIKQALFHSAIVPNLVDHPVPPPHLDLMRYFDLPSKVVKKSRQPLEECRRVFNLAPVLQKVAKRKAEMHVAAIDDDDLILAPSKKFRQNSPRPDENVSPIPLVDLVDESLSAVTDRQELTETESENDDENRQKGIKITVSPEHDHSTKATEVIKLQPSGTTDDIMVDHAIPKGRIVGSIYPLEDFKNNLKSGDVVTKAVEDLAFILQEIAFQPFAERRHNEIIECLTEMRGVCLREDEVDLWNE